MHEVNISTFPKKEIFNSCTETLISYFQKASPWFQTWVATTHLDSGHCVSQVPCGEQVLLLCDPGLLLLHVGTELLEGITLLQLVAPVNMGEEKFKISV